MVERVLNKASLGGQLWLSSLLYIGIGCLLLAASPEPTPAVAQCSTPCDEAEDCPTGMFCCDGECIDDANVCCEDGTYGDAADCQCCTGCHDSQCVTESTLVCEEDLDGHY